MKIYIVKHCYSNGESYEDYRYFEDYSMYSSLTSASHKFWNSVTEDYEGKYQLIEWELDTQENQILEESEWIECTPSYFYNPAEPTYEYEDDDESLDPAENIEDCWEWVKQQDEFARYYEWDAEWEYLNSEGTNLKEWEECEREIQERKSQAQLKEINDLLDQLIK